MKTVAAMLLAANVVSAQYKRPEYGASCFDAPSFMLYTNAKCEPESQIYPPKGAMDQMGLQEVCSPFPQAKGYIMYKCDKDYITWTVYSDSYCQNVLEKQVEAKLENGWTYCMDTGYGSYSTFRQSGWGSQQKEESTTDKYDPYDSYKTYDPYDSYKSYDPYDSYKTYDPYDSYKTYDPYASDYKYDPYDSYKTYDPYASDYKYDSYGQDYKYDSYGSDYKYDPYSYDYKYDSYGTDYKYDPYGTDYKYDPYGTDYKYDVEYSYDPYGSQTDDRYEKTGPAAGGSFNGDDGEYKQGASPMMSVMTLAALIAASAVNM